MVKDLEEKRREQRDDSEALGEAIGALAIVVIVTGIIVLGMAAVVVWWLG